MLRTGPLIDKRLLKYHGPDRDIKHEKFRQHFRQVLKYHIHALTPIRYPRKKCDRCVFLYGRKNSNGRPILVTETNLHSEKQEKNHNNKKEVELSNL